MERIILRRNSAHVYEFLCFINERHTEAERTYQGRILDCGAGGPVPPLALFAQYGYEAWGIDISDGQLSLASHFCQQQGLDVHFRQADMRKIPFEDESFEYVYEHYSMCHLSKKDTASTIQEMYRVLKPQGLCLLGVMSVDCWPTSRLGQEMEPGEFWGDEGDEGRLHSLFSDEEIEDLLSGWEIVFKEKQVRTLWGAGNPSSKQAWMDAHATAGSGYSRAAWEAQYGHRADEFHYAHLFYIVRKP